MDFYRLTLLLIPSLTLAATPPDLAGKVPDWSTDEEKSGATVHPVGKSLNAPLIEFSLGGQTPEGPAAHQLAPLPLTTLSNAVAFVRSQRGQNGQGLPALFWAPEGTRFPDPLEFLLVQEGVGLYDTALAILVLVDAGQLEEARHILDIYASGHYTETASAPMELRAMPARNNNDAFSPFTDDTYYFFDFTNVYGDWMRWGERWKFWTAHTGPNAWLANAALHYVIAERARGTSESRLKPIIHLAETIGRAMQRLQDKETQGAIRYGPQGMWHAEDTSAPYVEINSENNISAYATFQMLARVTGKSTYSQSANRILHWFSAGEVQTAPGQKQIGLLDRERGTLAMGATWKENQWHLQSEHPTDAGGTWAISSLGAATIDKIWGPKAAYRMWQRLRQQAGRTEQFTLAIGTQSVAGLDFMDGFPLTESLISPEWTGGGIFALRELLAYYDKGPGHGLLTPVEFAGLMHDAQTMETFVRQNPNPYALGPGHGGHRQGATGFHWSSPPENVHALASVYFTLALTKQTDPLGDWRLHASTTN